MSKDVESRVYTINLSKVQLTPKRRRTKRAVNMIREFASRHMKSEEIKIDAELNEELWSRSIRHPPRKVRVRLTKDEDGVVTVSAYAEEAKEEEKPETKQVAAAPTVEEAKPAAEEKVEPKIEEKPQEEPEKVELSEEDLAKLIEEEAAGTESEKTKARRKKEEVPE